MKKENKEEIKRSLYRGVFGIGMGAFDHFLIPEHTVPGTFAKVLTFLLIQSSVFGCLNALGDEKDAQKTQGLRENYQLFLERYKKLNHEMEVEHPYEIYEMHLYLLENGYLSDGKSFHWVDKKYRDFYGLFGATVMSGEALCRHLSMQLRDIYKGEGIDSQSLAILYLDGCFDIIFSDKEQSEEEKNEVRRRIEEYLSRILKGEELEQMLQDVHRGFQENGSGELVKRFQPCNNVIERVLGNHSITCAQKDGVSYFLDPTNEKTYILKDGKKGILTDGEFTYPIKRFMTYGYYEGEHFLEDYRALLKGRNPSFQEEQEILKSTLTKCRNNLDVFESFYQENQELYHDTHEKLLQLSK